MGKATTRRTRRHRRRAKARAKDNRAVRKHARIGGRTGSILSSQLKGRRALKEEEKMGRWYPKGQPRKPSKHANLAHKKRAQKRKKAFGGLAAFCQTNAGSRRQRKRQHSGVI